MKRTVFLFVANRYDGCGHRHRALSAAKRCKRLMQSRGFKRAGIYRVTTERVG